MTTSPRDLPEHVSEATTARLSVYLRCLDTLADEGVRSVSSSELAERFQLNAALIRKDLANFGEFGVRGVGYEVQALRSELRRLLGLDRLTNLVVVGAGNLGRALAAYQGFRPDEFQVVALFDVADDKVDRRLPNGIPVRHLRDLNDVVRVASVRIAAVAVPAAAAQEVADAIVASGIRAILNFAPVPLRVPPAIKLKHVDVSVALEGLCFHLAQEAHDEKA